MGWRCEITMRTKLHGEICSLNLSACLSFWVLAYSIRLVGLSFWFSVVTYIRRGAWK